MAVQIFTTAIFSHLESPGRDYLYESNPSTAMRMQVFTICQKFLDMEVSQAL